MRSTSLTLVLFRDRRSARKKASPSRRSSACRRLTPLGSRMMWHSGDRPMTITSLLSSMICPAGSPVTRLRIAMQEDSLAPPPESEGVTSTGTRPAPDRLLAVLHVEQLLDQPALGVVEIVPRGRGG